MEITKVLIRDVVNKIVKEVKPDKVILFGSYSWGKPTSDSDLDLLIIKESTLRRDKRAMEIDKLFADRQFPLDVIVYTPEEVGQCVKLEGSFVKEILEHGEVLYDRAA